MFSGWKSFLLAGLIAAGIVGCAHHEEPTGLHGINVRQASDQMASNLLSSPALNASAYQWTIAVRNMEDQTSERGFGPNYDVFLTRLKGELFDKSAGRVTLIQNLDKWRELRRLELGRGAAGPTRNDASGDAINPDYVLDGVARDLPNGGTNYYQLEFTLTNLATGVIAWHGLYEVEVPR